MRATKTKNRKLVFIESTETPQAIKKQIAGKKLEMFDLWVRLPDSEKLDKMHMAARLCRCREVCLAVIEDEF